MVHRGQVSPFEVDELRKEMGGWVGEKKRRLPSEEMRTVASFSTVSSSPSTSVAYRKEHKGCFGIKKYTSAASEERQLSFFTPLSTYIQSHHNRFPPKKTNFH